MTMPPGSPRRSTSICSTGSMPSSTATSRSTAFRHGALWNDARGRIEMHLEAHARSSLHGLGPRLLDARRRDDPHREQPQIWQPRQPRPAAARPAGASSGNGPTRRRSSRSSSPRQSRRASRPSFPLGLAAERLGHARKTPAIAQRHCPPRGARLEDGKRPIGRNHAARAHPRPAHAAVVARPHHRRPGDPVLAGRLQRDQHAQRFRPHAPLRARPDHRADLPADPQDLARLRRPRFLAYGRAACHLGAADLPRRHLDPDRLSRAD